jgi:ABC-type oligopeptide transport system ATPase subunit
MSEVSSGPSIALEARDVWRVFETGAERLEVLRGVDLSIETGDFVSIVGPSGSGKSTLLHILGGLDRPTAGRVLLDGADVFGYSDSDLSELRNEKVGFVFQFHHLLAEFTVLENVALPLLIAGRERSDAYGRAQQVSRPGIWMRHRRCSSWTCSVRSIAHEARRWWLFRTTRCSLHWPVDGCVCWMGDSRLMKKKCDICGKNDATMKVRQMNKDGRVVDIDVCAACAQQRGFADAEKVKATATG